MSDAKTYTFSNIEAKWQQKWREDGLYKVDIDPARPKYYVLDMFPYPSGSGLHVGHPLGYIASDIVARYKRLKGHNVLHPMGYDAFGLPAEQYAIQTGQHPAVTTENNIKRFREQLDIMGFSFDWSREVRTCEPNYYKFTQFIFSLFFEHWYDKEAQKARPISHLISHFAQNGSQGVKAHGSAGPGFSAEQWSAMNATEQAAVLNRYRLAFQDETTVNWCEDLGTVLANEEVINGLSERGSYPVIRKKMTQWALRITAYTDLLLEGLDTLDWSDAVKEIQRNWIGKSSGAEIDFSLQGQDRALRVFTTRPDTIFGATFLVVAPEIEGLLDWCSAEQREAVESYKKQAAGRSEIERMADTRKTGVFTGAYAQHPFSGEPVPVWTSDYVLAGYGTGAIMAVPAHDERDFEFAQAFGLPIPLVIQPLNEEVAEPLTEAISSKEGRCVNSDFLNGLLVKEAIEKAIQELETRGLGQRKVNYKLREAGFGRQRYWGEPFPVIHNNGIPHLVKELPVELPKVESYKPSGSGESPLAGVSDWVNTPEGRRETDTMPGWAGSSWYFLRYLDPKNTEAIASPEALEYWKQVDLYVGGSEHATGHLLYSRFWTHFLHDLGYLSWKEPFQRLVNQGMIQGENGEKMSKSRGNVVNPDDVIAEHGADTLRLYEMFLGPLTDSKPWNTNGIEGVSRFLGKFWRLFHGPDGFKVVDEALTPEELKVLHKTIKKISHDIEAMSFNTSVSAFMVCTNELTALKCHKRAALEPLLILLAPFAPHLSEELWADLGHSESVHVASWPSWNEEYLKENSIAYPISINGKTRTTLELPADMEVAEIEKIVLADELVQKWMDGKPLRKIIVVKGRIVNVVV